MNDRAKKFSQHYFSKARITFEEANQLLAAGFPTGATNRFYYTAFYAAKALLMTKELSSSKHRGTIALFQQHFVKTGLVNEERAKTLHRSFEQRLSSDYDEFYFLSDNELQDLKQQVAEFLDECGKVLATLLKDGTSAHEPAERYSAKRSRKRKRLVTAIR